MKASNWTKWVLVPLGLVLVFSQTVFSGGPAAYIETLPGDVQYALKENLEHKKYTGNFEHWQALERGISAYLWDNRHKLKSTDFSKDRDVDALICLMHRQGYSGFEIYMDREHFKKWCNDEVLKP